MQLQRIHLRYPPRPAPLEPPEQPLGDILVRVRLSNAFDENGGSIMIDAVVDPQTPRTIIPRAVAEQLRLHDTLAMQALSQDGRWEPVPVTSAIRFEIEGRDTVEEAVVVGDHVVIGYVVLAKMDYVIDREQRKVIANPKHPEGPRIRI